MKLGGNFSFDESFFTDSKIETGKTVFLTGRHAFRAILKYLKATRGITKVVIPDYICESVYTACLLENFQVSFYRINSDLTAAVDDNNFQKDAAVLVVDYFGFSAEKNIVRIREFTDAPIILDRVMSYNDYPCDSEADFVFTALRKATHLPSGAFVKGISDDFYGTFDLESGEKYESLRKEAAFLKHKAPLKDSGHLEMFQEAENELDKSPLLMKAGSLYEALADSFDLVEISLKRKKNFKVLQEELSEFLIVDPGKLGDRTPLCFPVQLAESKRDLIREEMKENNIFLPVHWPKFNGLPKTKHNYAGTELSLLIDQRYGEKEMQYQIEVFKKVLRRI